MLGRMQHEPLQIGALLDHAARLHRDSRIVTQRRDGSTVSHSYPEIAARTARLAHALAGRGVAQGERLATLAWNDHRHLELYYGVSGIGAVCHTVNPRLFPDQIAYILADAGDTHLFLDPMFLPILAGIGDRLPAALKTLVLLEPPAEPVAACPRRPLRDPGLRGADRRPCRHLRLAGAGREHGRLPLLFLRHHR